VYLLFNKKSTKTVQAVANEAAMRLVLLHRENEDLADEKEKLEVRVLSLCVYVCLQACVRMCLPMCCMCVCLRFSTSFTLLWPYGVLFYVLCTRRRQFL